MVIFKSLKERLCLIWSSKAENESPLGDVSADLKVPYSYKFSVVGTEKVCCVT